MNPGRKVLRALLVEDSEGDALLLLEALRRGGYRVDWSRVETESAMRAALQERELDIVFCDYRLPQFDAPNAIRVLREIGSDVPAIIVSGTVGEDLAVESLKLGANDYLLKGNLKRLIPAVERELREAQLRRESRAAEERKREAEESLRQSEERYRVLFDRNPLPMWVFDPDTLSFLAVNDAAVAHYGYSREEFLSTTLRQIRIEESIPEMLSAITGIHENAQPTCFTFRHRKKDGTLIFVEVHNQTIHFNGRLARMGLALDITERRRAEEQLQESQMRLLYAQHLAQIGNWECFLKEDRMWWSDEMFELFGVSRTQFTGHTEDFLLAIHPDDIEHVWEHYRAAYKRGGFTEFEHRIVRPDGEIRHICERTEVVMDAAGRPLRQAGTAQDITERKVAEERLREQAALLNHAQDAILVRDLNDVIRFWNKGGERLYGWTAEEAIGRKVNELLYDDDSPFFEARNIVLEKGFWTGELQHIDKDGREITVEGRWTLVRDDAGLPKSVLSINTDITERRKLQAQSFRAQRMESIGTLAGGIAHDLNNVLSPIIMAIDLLKLRLTEPGDLDVLDIMETSGRRGADMVKQVLLFARGTEATHSLVSPALLVKEMQKIPGETFPKSITVQADVSDGIWNVLGDPTQLHQVLLNLCINARDAMSNGGCLRITARNILIDEQFAAMQPHARPGPHVVMEVADTGEGMPPEVIARIFEPFYTTKEVGKGTGLGLSTTRAIVQSHCGFLTVESEPGAGSTFKVHLPAKPEHAEVRPEIEAGKLPHGNGELVLIIDDEATIRTITGKTLETAGYRVMSACDGAEGIAMYGQHSGEIAVVLTDMMMPGLSGATTISVLIRINPEVKIIAASGLSAKGVEAAASSEGVKYFLPKPYSAETMLSMLRKLLHPDK